MTKRERFLAAIRGETLDRPPVTAWVHFVTDEAPPELFAERAAAFFERFDFDLCKVVNDYRYPLPAGLETLESPRDMERIRPLAEGHPWFSLQPRAIRLLRDRLGPDVPIIDTAFDSLQLVLRRAGYNRAKMLLADRDRAAAMLEIVTGDMARYLRAVREAGADGVFFSINGAITAGRRAVDAETFEALMRPFDLRLLAAAAPMVRILHVHGAPVDVRRVLDYPIEVLSVSDRLPGNPSLAELRAMTALPLMGGIDESVIAERSVTALRAEIADAVTQNGGVRGLILAPACTIPTQTPSFLLRAMVEAVKGFAPAPA